MKSDYLKATYYLDYESFQIQNLVENFHSLTSEQEKIKQLYLFIRDHWRYNPYTIGLTQNHFRASTISEKKDGHCIDKSILYVAGLRALGIPARLRLAKVSNHIAVERLEEKLGTHHIAPHGLVEVFLNNKWVKCSPAFNKTLCDLYNVDVLDFDGSEDSIFQEYNKANTKFMSYAEDYGSFEDVPFEFIKETFRNNYPKLYSQYKGSKEIKI